MAQTWVIDNNCAKHNSIQLAVSSYGVGLDFGCIHSDLREMTSCQGHDITFGSMTAIVGNIKQIQLGGKELWPGHGFWLCVHTAQ